MHEALALQKEKEKKLETAPGRAQEGLRDQL
jgi:hypothetical protein